LLVIDSFRGRYRFLSNFSPAIVVYNKNAYPTVEHAYQAAKTLDEDWQEAIFWAKSPTEAKRLGRKVPLREDWEQIKLKVMEDLLRQKFSTFEMKSKLLATGNEHLVEGNTWGDNFWGAVKVKKLRFTYQTYYTWEGKNHLGKLLMKIREEIREDL